MSFSTWSNLTLECRYIKILTLIFVLLAWQFTKESGNKMEEVKLRVTYVAPPQPPSPVPEESEEGSPPRASESESGDGPAGGFTRVSYCDYWTSAYLFPFFLVRR